MASYVTLTSTAATAISMVAVLAGCSTTTGHTSDATGPWASEIKREYEKATSADVRKALQDGLISDQEFAEMKARYSDCLKSAGITLKKYDLDGSETAFAPPVTADIAHQKESECSHRSGEYPISYLYRQMRVNPENQDMAALIVGCFQREGLVEKNYTVKDYTAGNFSFADDTEKKAALESCELDPLRRLGG